MNVTVPGSSAQTSWCAQDKRSARKGSSQGQVFFFGSLQKFKEYSRLCLGKWASPAYDTVDPRKGDLALG